MKVSWRSFLNYDPFPALKQITSPALSYFIQRDLFDENPGPIEELWTLPEPIRILKKQLDSGAWPDQRPKKHLNSPTNYLLLETYRNMGVLIELYGFNKTDKSIEKAAEFIFSTESSEGDFRGIYGNQYSTNYSAGILELLVKAGYLNDNRIHRAFQWFLSNQQDKGGWTLPLQTHGVKTLDSEAVMSSPTKYPFETEKAFSHSVTGIVLRAFAAHPQYRNHPDAKKAADLITHRFFLSDKYTFRKDASYWKKYSFPFWWTDLISILDSLSLMKFPRDNHGIARALTYFKSEQLANGMWNLYILKGKSLQNLQVWLNVVLYRLIKRFFDIV